ncbi:MAG: hypothetical protein HY815_03475 [Candidatus Riflebacteria bacterium]|nr:hypothetical protein [Candidatus Riflebacteria bacterium]
MSREILYLLAWGILLLTAFCIRQLQLETKTSPSPSAATYPARTPSPPKVASIELHSALTQKLTPKEMQAIKADADAALAKAVGMLKTDKFKAYFRKQFKCSDPASILPTQRIIVEELPYEEVTKRVGVPGEAYTNYKEIHLKVEILLRGRALGSSGGIDSMANSIVHELAHIADWLEKGVESDRAVRGQYVPEEVGVAMEKALGLTCDQNVWVRWSFDEALGEWRARRS